MIQRFCGKDGDLLWVKNTEFDATHNGILQPACKVCDDYVLILFSERIEDDGIRVNSSTKLITYKIFNKI